jgi:hypothetical protein
MERISLATTHALDTFDRTSATIIITTEQSGIL